MRGLIVLANGYEDNEALTTRDVLIRSGLDIITTSINNTKVVVSSHGLATLSDITINEVDNLDYDFIILPGGLKGVNNIKNSDDARNLIMKFYRGNKDIYAICAAPSILIELNILKDIPFTCFPSFEKGQETYYTGEGVTSSGRFITAKSMYYSIDFALKIIEKKLGAKVAEKVLKSLKGEE